MKLIDKNKFGLAVPVIAAADVLSTVTWFVRTLGFKQQWIWGEPPVYAGIRSGGAMLYISRDPDMADVIQSRGLMPDIFLWVEDIEHAYDQHQANGAEIVEPLSERPWGVRQYVVREPNGYRLKIAESDAA
jgi:uncharacterized glyoxalase superfamily protein PhnB